MKKLYLLFLGPALAVQLHAQFDPNRDHKAAAITSVEGKAFKEACWLLASSEYKFMHLSV